MDTEDKKIELRSENMRNIIGQVPPFIIRWGNVILCLILGCLVLSAILIPFPYKISSKVYVKEVTGERQLTIYIPEETAYKLYREVPVSITLSAYQNKRFSPVTGRIERLYDTKELKEGVLYQKISINVQEGITGQKEELLQSKEAVNGTMTLHLGNKTWWERISQ